MVFGDSGYGHLTGFAAKYIRFPIQKLAVIILTNQANCDPDAIAQGVAGLAEPALIPTAMLQEQPDTDFSLTHRLVAAVTDLAHATASPIICEELRKVITAGTQEILGSALPSIASLRFLTEDEVNGKGIEANGLSVIRIRAYRSKMAGRTRYFRFFLTGDTKLAGVSCWDQD
jgi:hypothetical protein